ncbi:MAG: hypothetical protein WKF46_10870 [Candidatus Limnocylindrales bacterium]
MESLLLALALLACPVGMGVMMWMMGRGMRGDKREPQNAQGPTSTADLRSEQARIAGEIARLEQRNGRSQVPS